MKYSGYYLLFTGVIHNIIGLLLGWPVLMDMHRDVWFASTIVNGEMQFDREAIIWFLNAGCFWIMFGWTLQKAINQGFTPPRSLGWGFAIIGVINVIILPVSGAYLFIIQGGILIYGVSNRKRLDAKVHQKT
ncbi:DUF6463 family protein [Alteromonas oceanisediminis]|uniref:DUF6463 family protein n=1 Tax=Alteromonas oceanisediminis TaxID=2836180 RepID=UPI001BD98C6E|nr:DUF6463 family protein [Alteromonas oceanisediminis]MBT0588046.1 hypothetical protein [Alteromonas oceanisediminis]